MTAPKSLSLSSQGRAIEEKLCMWPVDSRLRGQTQWILAFDGTFLVTEKCSWFADENGQIQLFNPRD